MDKVFELYKDGVFLGERPKVEVEQIAKANEEFGYRLLIYDDGCSSGIAMLEKDPKRLERAEKYIIDFNKIMNDPITTKYPQSTLEVYRKALLRLIFDTSGLTVKQMLRRNKKR
jgi:hypothetical protein